MIHDEGKLNEPNVGRTNFSATNLVKQKLQFSSLNGVLVGNWVKTEFWCVKVNSVNFSRHLLLIWSRLTAFIVIQCENFSK
jgi:hypothetical protein